MVDIFEIRANPDPDDVGPAGFTDVGGEVVTYTIERIIRLGSNALSGHDPLCGMPDCDPMEHPKSQVNREIASAMGQPVPEPVIVMRCLVEGPMTPEIQAQNMDIDEEIKDHMRERYPHLGPIMDAAKAHKAKRRVGFDIERQSDEPR